MKTPPKKEQTDLGPVLQMLHMQLLRTRQRVYALEAERQLTREKKTPRMPVEFRSQFGEDIFVWDALGGQKQGFFIEVGAFDGYHYSVTYALEAVGWDGLLIEAIPKRFEQCKVRRPHSRVVNAALSRDGSTGTTRFTVADDHYGGMLSFLDENNAQGQQIKATMPTTTVTVPLTSMNALLGNHRAEIDLAVIDVEGGELDLLDGFDLVRYRPRVLLLEDNTRGADPALGDYMKKMPYHQVGWLEVNRVYVRDDCEDIRDRLIEISHDL